MELKQRVFDVGVRVLMLASFILGLFLIVDQGMRSQAFRDLMYWVGMTFTGGQMVVIGIVAYIALGLLTWLFWYGHAEDCDEDFLPEGQDKANPSKPTDREGGSGVDALPVPGEGCGPLCDAEILSCGYCQEPISGCTCRYCAECNVIHGADEKCPKVNG